MPGVSDIIFLTLAIPLLLWLGIRHLRDLDRQWREDEERRWQNYLAYRRDRWRPARKPAPPWWLGPLVAAFFSLYLLLFCRN